MDKKWDLSGDSSLEKSGESIVEQIAKAVVERCGKAGASSRFGGGIIAIATEEQVHRLCMVEGYELVDHYEVTYPEGFIASGRQLTQGYNGLPSKVMQDYNSQSDACRAEIVKSRRFIMRKSLDTWLVELQHELDEAVREGADLRKEMEERKRESLHLSERLDSVRSLLEAECKRHEATNLSLNEFRAKTRLMESDLGRLREVLGSERFDEIVKSKKDKV